MKRLLLCMCMLFSMGVFADQGETESDAEFYSHKENLEIHEPEFYEPFDDGHGHVVHLKRLSRSSFDRNDPSYWRWFDQYPCMYDLGYHEDTCKNPPYDDDEEFPDIDELPKNCVQSVPEPETLLLLGAGFIGFYFNYKRNNK